MTFTTTATLPSDREITVTRKVRAPRELVWRAYTDTALIPRWLLGPPGWTMPVCEMDARVGGAYRWTWRADADGSEMTLHGVSREVQPPVRWVATQLFEPGGMGVESLVTLELAEEGGVTTIVTNVLYASKEIRDAATSTGMVDGMEAGYQRLEALLPGFAAA